MFEAVFYFIKKGGISVVDKDFVAFAALDGNPGCNMVLRKEADVFTM